MFDGLTPDLAPRLVLAIGGVGVAFVVLVLVLIFLKRRNSPLFIKGGKSREPRLLVLDAAAIDPKRRLVLIRRDDVEHLIMIGGPTDIVIETGILDRTKSAAVASRTIADEPPASRPMVAAPAPEHRPVAPAPERRAEPSHAAAAVETEMPVAAPVEARAVLPSVQPAARTVPMPANVAPAVVATAALGVERMTPAAERLVERPTIERATAERRPEARNVSAAGPMLYGDDREPTPAVRPLPRAVSAQTQQVSSQLQPVTPAERPTTPVASAAEAALDAARQRVLPNSQTPAASMTTATSDAEKALAARLDSARTDMMRRVQSAQPAGQTMAQPVVEPTIEKPNPATETSKIRDADPSDFEKLLEAELDANGVFGQAPQVRGESRITNAAPADGVAPPVRARPPITGATPDVTSEEEVARLLGEIAVNRKP